MGHGILRLLLSGGTSDNFQENFDYTIYILHGHVQEVVSSGRYLGVDISNGMS